MSPLEQGDCSNSMVAEFATWLKFRARGRARWQRMARVWWRTREADT